MICVMNQPSADPKAKGTTTSTILVDDAKMNQEINQESETNDEENSLVSDLAKLLADKICKKSGLV